MKDVRIFFAANEYEDEHLGLMSLSSVLNLHGHRPRVIRADYNTLEKELAVQKDVLTVIAFSTTSFTIEHFIDISRRIKDDFDVLTVFGGYYASGNPDIIAKEGVDAVCIGEGEYAFLELIDRLVNGRDVTDIKNFWIKQGEKIYKNPLRPQVENLDTLPFSDRDLFKKKSLFFYDRIYVITSRGCLFKCPHCYNSTYRSIYRDGMRYRRRSVDDVLKEIKEIQERQPVKFIVFYDDIFILPTDWLKEFSQKYKKEINIPFRCNLRIDLITPEILGYLKDANCHIISFGAECGDDHILKEVLKRNMTVEQIVEKSRMVKEYGIKLRTSNMIGIEGGSIDVDLKTVELNIRCKVDYALVSMFRSYPKTDFSRERQDSFSTGSSDFLVNIEGYSSMDDIGYLRRLPSSFCEPDFGFKTEQEKRMISNLHELFTLTVSFPALLPLVRLLIKLPLKRIYIYVNLLWSWYASFFILYPTCGRFEFLIRFIKRKLKISAENITRFLRTAFLYRQNEAK